MVPARTLSLLLVALLAACNRDTGPSAAALAARAKAQAASNRNGVVGNTGRKAPMMPTTTIDQPKAR